MEIGNSSLRDVKQASETFALKKALEASSDMVSTIVASIEQNTPATVNPAHLGQHVDVKA